MSRRKARDFTRRAGTTKPAARFVVVTEGKLTETDYLRVLGRCFGHQAVRLISIGGVGDPRAVVERAIKKAGEARGEKLGVGDVVWAMFDRDEHERFDEAVALAGKHGIPLAISNPCFELWGIFHYCDHDAPLNSRACQRRLEELCEHYDRRRKSFASEELVREAHNDAVERGRRSLVLRRELGDPGGSPSTTVHCLTEEYRRFADRLRN